VTAVFEEQCGCTLNLVGLDDVVSILSRLRLEGTHSKADIALGLDLSRLTIPAGWKNLIFAPFDYGYFAFFDEGRVVGVYETSLLFSNTPPPEIAGYMFRPAQ
jgi:ABC-type thiamine transport system substrate-binding protein